MTRGGLGASIECSVRAGGVGVIVHRGMTCFRRLTGALFKALIRISPAWVQHGEPGKRREVHKSRNLTGISLRSQGLQANRSALLCCID